MAATALSACSNDAIRFEEALTTASIGNTDNQQQIIYKRQPTQARAVPASEQPFPSDVDRTTQTGSVRQAANGIRISRPPVASSRVTRSPLPKLHANGPLTPAAAPTVSYSKPSVIAPGLSSRVARVPAVKKPITRTVNAVRTAPTVAYRPPTLAPTPRGLTPGIAALPPRGSDISARSTGTNVAAAKPAPLFTGSTKRQSIPTQSVKQTTAAPARPTAGSGWTKTGGTWVSVGQGETLYNLSRRYGVPVSAIAAANSISDPSKVSSGTRVLIPTYSYGSSAPISAPDHDPKTKASNATRGFQGEVLSGRVAKPSYRVAAPTNLPDPLAVTPSQRRMVSGNGYTVKSGDTLYGIARSHGVSVEAIQGANGKSDTKVRVGEVLKMPSGTTVARNSSQVGSQITGSVPAPSVAKPTVRAVSPRGNIRSTAPKPAPKATASVASSFSWPAKGRVLARFGERIGGRTNDGIDISMPIGSPVRAAQGGKVIYAGSELEDFGQLILLSHANGWVSAYAHASQTLVKRGDTVRKGQVIAKSGQSGTARTPRLHFELRKNSSPVNPLNHLD
ncbi:MAG: peptidoglycan DD-metalloendopeptidase family protein [Pseudomonadota bacterium]